MKIFGKLLRKVQSMTFGKVPIHQIESFALSLGENLFRPELSECTERDSFPSFSHYPEADCKSVIIFRSFVVRCSEILEIFELLDEIFKNNEMAT